MSKDYLAHHGIKGMKWGVRRSESSGGSSTSKLGPDPKHDAVVKKLQGFKTTKELHDFLNDEGSKNGDRDFKIREIFPQGSKTVTEVTVYKHVGLDDAAWNKLSEKDRFQDLTLETEGHPDFMHHGIKGMKWGVRRKNPSGSSSGSSDNPPGHDKPHESGEPRKVVGAASGETSSDRYNRLLVQAKNNGPNSLDEQDLKFVTARQEAIKKVAKLNETNPNWLKDAAKAAGKQAVQNGMNSISNAVVDKYISGPMIASLKNSGAKTAITKEIKKKS